MILAPPPASAPTQRRRRRMTADIASPLLPATKRVFSSSLFFPLSCPGSQGFFLPPDNLVCIQAPGTLYEQMGRGAPATFLYPCPKKKSPKFFAKENIGRHCPARLCTVKRERKRRWIKYKVRHTKKKAAYIWPREEERISSRLCRATFILAAGGEERGGGGTTSRSNPFHPLVKQVPPSLRQGYSHPPFPSLRADRGGTTLEERRIDRRRRPLQIRGGGELPLHYSPPYYSVNIE